MWDSFKESPENAINVFDAHQHINLLCKEHKVAISEYTRTAYQKGWSELMSSLVIELKGLPIRLIDVDDSNGQLEIKFEMLKKRHEVIAWRILDAYKDQSRIICMSCGRKASNIKSNGLNLRLCTDCYLSAAKNGKTGTWLDKY